MNDSVIDGLTLFTCCHRLSQSLSASNNYILWNKVTNVLVECSLKKHIWQCSVCRLYYDFTYCCGTWQLTALCLSTDSFCCTCSYVEHSIDIAVLSVPLPPTSTAPDLYALQDCSSECSSVIAVIISERKTSSLFVGETSRRGQHRVSFPPGLWRLSVEISPAQCSCTDVPQTHCQTQYCGEISSSVLPNNDW